MIRAAIPDAAITSDVIVGFPGETEDDFGETLRIMREAPFMKTHIFPFSRREGTPAATMDGQVHSKDIRDRYTILHLGADLGLLDSWVGDLIP